MKHLILLIVMAFSASAVAAYDYEYTSVRTEDCITLDSSEFDDPQEIDYYSGICRGQGPYVITVSGGDIRYSIDLLYRGNPIGGLTKTNAFHNPGSDVVEWRYQVSSSGTRTLKALIFRINADDGQGGDVDLMHIVKLNKESTCTVAVLSNVTNLNQRARQVADNIDAYTCL